MSDSTSLVFIDLHSFSKKEEECESLEDIWMYSIKNMHSLLACPERFKGTEIEDLYVKSELAKMTVEQRLKYEEGIMTRNDILNSISEQLEDARKEAAERGAAEGRAKGLAEGRAEGRVDNIRKMLAAGIPVSTIADALGITIEECESAISGAFEQKRSKDLNQR